MQDVGCRMQDARSKKKDFAILVGCLIVMALTACEATTHAASSPLAAPTLEGPLLPTRTLTPTSTPAVTATPIPTLKPSPTVIPTVAPLTADGWQTVRSGI